MQVFCDQIHPGDSLNHSKPVRNTSREDFYAQEHSDFVYLVQPLITLNNGTILCTIL